MAKMVARSGWLSTLVMVLAALGCGGTKESDKKDSSRKEGGAKESGKKESGAATTKSKAGSKAIDPNGTNNEKQPTKKAEPQGKAAPGPQLNPPGNKPGPGKSAARSTPVEPKGESPSSLPKVAAANGVKPNRPSLAEQLTKFQVPPAWLADVRPNWDTAKPWKEARIEIRRLLGTNDEAMRRQGIKLTWQYHLKKDIGNGHEYGMYMFLGKEPLWAIVAYREYVKRSDLTYPPFFGIRALASLYVDYGLFEEAEKLLTSGLQMSPPKRAWKEMRQAEMHDSLGDLYVAWKKPEKAKASYGQALRLYPLANPPYGKHLLPRNVKKIRSKMDLLSMQSLQGTTLRDGTYRETALGYSGDIKLTLQVRDGKIANIDVRHKEKIDQNACVLIPRRIVSAQHLQVDGITGATVTKDAIVAGTLRALKQAGLQ